ncbi:MAG: hypothetical protein ACFCU1_00685 [Sumerlaeia bacterium]
MERNLVIQLGIFFGAVVLLLLAILLQKPMIPRQNPELLTLTESITLPDEVEADSPEEERLIEQGLGNTLEEAEPLINSDTPNSFRTNLETNY